MTHQPLLEERGEQPYVAIRCTVGDEAGLRAAIDRAFPELFGWLAERGLEPTGPPFIRFLVVGADGVPRELEVAAPLAELHPGGDRVSPGILPAGRYATVLHVGPYQSDSVADLAAARATLEAWAEREGVRWDCEPDERGTTYRGCIERYLTGPAEEPDWTRWRTEIAYLAASAPVRR